MQISEYINKLIESKDNNLTFIINESQTKHYRIFNTSITGLVEPVLAIYEQNNKLYDNILNIPIADTKDINLKAFEERANKK